MWEGDIRSALMNTTAAGTWKERFYQGIQTSSLLLCTIIASLHRNIFPCFLKRKLIAFAGKGFKPNKSLITLLSLHKLLQCIYKTIFHFLIMFDILISQAWRFVCFWPSGHTYRDRFKYSMFLACWCPRSLWHKGDSDLTYKKKKKKARNVT